jgi:Septum formation
MADDLDAVATRPDPPAAGKPAKQPKASKPPKAPKPARVRAPKPPKPPKPPKAEKPKKPDKPVKPAKAAKAPKAEKPAKPPKSARPGKPVRNSQTEPLAPIAFVASLLSATTAGVAAIPALLLARQAKREIAARPGATGLGMARAATVIAVLSLVGWASFGVFALARATSSTGVDYATLTIGDCIETPAGESVRRVDIVSCDKPHDAEVFAVATHPAQSDEPFPGVPALLEFAADACLGQAFVEYVGVPRIRSQLTDYEFVPGEEGWSEGRRGIVCVVDSSDGLPLTGSVKGSRR